jgi:hypothetical protein
MKPESPSFDIFARFGQLLREKGYDTSEKIDRLVKEIKHETTEDWLRRCLRLPHASRVSRKILDEGE